MKNLAGDYPNIRLDATTTILFPVDLSVTLAKCFNDQVDNVVNLFVPAAIDLIANLTRKRALRYHQQRV